MLESLREYLKYIRRAISTSQFWIAAMVIFWLFSWNNFTWGTSTFSNALTIMAALISIILIVPQILYDIRTDYRHWAILFIVHVVFWITILVFRGNVIEDMLLYFYLRFAVLGGLGLVLVARVKDARLLLFWFVVFSGISFLFLIRTVVREGTAILLIYYMPTSYQLLYLAVALPTIFLMFRIRLGFLVSFVVFLSLLIFLGTRGAILSYVAFAVILLLVQKGRIIPFARITALAIIIIAFLSIASLMRGGGANLWAGVNEITGQNSNRLSSMEARGGDISGDSGRGEYYDIIKEGIRNSPFGMGIGSDRELLYDPTTGRRSYAHNIYLEVLLHFGYIFGAILLLWLHYLMLMGLIWSKDRYWQAMTVICIAIWYFPHIVSSTYLISQTLVVVGIILSSYSLRKKVPVTRHIELTSV